MSVAQHVQKVIMSCAQTVHGLRTLRAHGVTNSTLQMFYHAVSCFCQADLRRQRLVKESYIMAWYGFCTAADR